MGRKKLENRSDVLDTGYFITMTDEGCVKQCFRGFETGSISPVFESSMSSAFLFNTIEKAELYYNFIIGFYSLYKPKDETIKTLKIERLTITKEIKIIKENK